MPRARDLDIASQKSGMLTALRQGRTDGRKRWWLYQCDCGKTCEKRRADIAANQKKGRISNCGCKTKEFIGNATRKHGMTWHPAYWVWRSMKDRCRLPSHQAWKNYGARGITVCPEWLAGFETFWREMGPTYQHGLELDRIDNNAGYSKANCRWTTVRVQTNNKRGNLWLETPKGRMTAAQASRVFQIGVTTIHYRLSRGWPADLVFADPKFSNRVGASMTFSTQDRAADLSSEEVAGRL